MPNWGLLVLARAITITRTTNHRKLADPSIDAQDIDYGVLQMVGSAYLVHRAKNDRHDCSSEITLISRNIFDFQFLLKNSRAIEARSELVLHNFPGK